MNLLWIILGLAGAKMLTKKSSAPTAQVPTGQPRTEPTATPEPEETKPEQSVIMPSETKTETAVVPSNLGGNYPVVIINGVEVPEFPYNPANFTSPYKVESGKFPQRPFKRQYLTPDEVFAYFAVYLSKLNIDKITWQLQRDVLKKYSLSDELDYFLFLNKMKEEYFTGKIKPVDMGILKPGLYRAPYDLGILEVYNSSFGIRLYTDHFVESEVLKLPKLPGFGYYKLLGSNTQKVLNPNTMLPGLRTDEWRPYQWIAVKKNLFNVKLSNASTTQKQDLLSSFKANLANYNLTEWTIKNL